MIKQVLPEFNIKERGVSAGGEKTKIRCVFRYHAEPPDFIKKINL